MNSTKPWHLLLLSAKTQSALERANANLIRHLGRKPELNLEHAAFTLQVGREFFHNRKMIVCRDLADAVSSSDAPQRVFTTFSKEKDRKVVFLLADQVQANNVAKIREIYAVEATFKNEVDCCLKLLQSIARLDLTGEIFPTAAQTGNVLAAPDRIIADRFMQFIAGYALAMQWMSWGVKPVAMVAVGVGEYVAAVLAGACSLEEALKLISHTHEAATPSEQTFAADGITLRSAQIPFLSASCGVWIGEGESAACLPALVAQPAGVILNEALLAKLANSILLEVGFGLQLTAEIQRACTRPLKDKFAFVDLSAECGARDEACFALITALGRLCLYGATIDWKSFHHGRAVRRIPLPAYPFAQERFWLLPGKTHQETSAPNDRVSPALDIRVKRQPATDRKDAHPRPELENDYVAPRDEIEMQLVEICGALLKIDNIGMEDNIITLGADSMFTIQLSNRIAQAFAVEISPHHLFERPNLQSLADQIKAKNPVVPAPMTQRTSSVNDRHRSSAVLEKSDDIETMIGKMTEEEVDAMLMRFALAG